MFLSTIVCFTQKALTGILFNMPTGIVAPHRNYFINSNENIQKSLQANKFREYFELEDFVQRVRNVNFIIMRHFLHR